MPIATIRLERHAAADRLAAERDRAIDDDREQRDHERRADEAELLDEHREHEVGMRFGQIEELLHALAEPDAEPLAAPDRDQRLRELEPARVRVGPRIEELRQALEAIGRGERERAEREAADECPEQEVAHPRARDEQHSKARRREHDRRAEVGLEQQQHRRRADQEQRLEQSLRSLDASSSARRTE